MDKDVLHFLYALGILSSINMVYMTLNCNEARKCLLQFWLRDVVSSNCLCIVVSFAGNSIGSNNLSHLESVRQVSTSYSDSSDPHPYSIISDHVGIRDGAEGMQVKYLLI